MDDILVSVLWDNCASVFRPERFTIIKKLKKLIKILYTCLMSLTAKRPRGGKSEKASTHMGLLGTSLTIAASPDLMNLGLSSVDLP